MKKTYLILGLLFAFCNIYFFNIEVGALHYTPGVNLGDKIVWKVFIENEYEKYIQHEIKAIWDYNDSLTCINTSVTEWKENNNSDSDPTTLIFSLFNYSVFPYYLLVTYYIIPGTKMSEYIDGIELYFQEVPNNLTSINSVNDGNGLEWIINNGTEFEKIFNKQGLMESFSAYDFESGHFYMTLWSINGKKYHIIPNTRIFVYIVSSFIGLLIVYHYTEYQIVNKKSG